jgi:hypothetical protein
MAVIKGASNIEIRVGTQGSRVSSDLDTVRRTTVDEFRDVFATAMRAGWAGFTGVLVDDGGISVPAPDGYRPHRFRAKLEYRGGPFGTLTVEVAPEEVGGLAMAETVPVHDAVDWFNELGLLDPQSVSTLPLAHEEAQKLHACTAPDEETWVNDRAHDLVDLHLAMRVYTGSLAEIRDIAMRLFAARRHSWPPAVTARQGWRPRYTAAAAGLDVHADLETAVSWANDCIANIDAAEPQPT